MRKPLVGLLGVIAMTGLQLASGAGVQTVTLKDYQDMLKYSQKTASRSIITGWRGP